MDEDILNFDGYQEAAHSFASYGDRTTYPILALAEEAGEVCGKFAKALRKGVEPDVEAIKKELGDVLWNVAEIATLLDLDLSDVAWTNIAKLQDREDRGVVCGEGDNR
jgi:NTP pyrophosphatase (non-canonical NTP hydrolase)